MRQLVAGLIIGVLMNGRLLLAGITDDNGDFWNQLSNAAKLGYVDGYFDGVRVSAAAPDKLKIAAVLFHWKGVREIIQKLPNQDRAVSGSWWKSKKASRSGELSHNSHPLAGGYRRMTLWKGIAGADGKEKARWKS